MSHPRGFLLPEWVLFCPHGTCSIRRELRLYSHTRKRLEALLTDLPHNGTCSIRRELRATHILAKDLNLVLTDLPIMGLVQHLLSSSLVPLWLPILRRLAERWRSCARPFFDLSLSTRIQPCLRRHKSRFHAAEEDNSVMLTDERSQRRIKFCDNLIIGRMYQ